MNLGREWLHFLQLEKASELTQFQALLWLETGVDWPPLKDLFSIIYEGNVSCSRQFLDQLRHCCIKNTWNPPEGLLDIFINRHREEIK